MSAASNTRSYHTLLCASLTHRFAPTAKPQQDVPDSRACEERSPERLVDGRPFAANQPCTELGIAFTPKDPQASSSPLLNEREDSKHWSPGIGAIIAELWPQLFQVMMIAIFAAGRTHLPM